MHLLLLLVLLGGLAGPGTTRAEAAPDQSRMAQLLQREFSSDHALAGELARLTVEEPRLKEKKGRVELSFTLRQQQETPLDLQIPLLIVTPQRSFTTSLPSHRAATSFSLELTDRPTEIRLDPYQELPRRLSREETPPTWAGFMAAEQRLAIIPEEPPTAWAPLMAWLEQAGITALPLSAVENRQPPHSSLLFLGSEKENPARGFFATPLHQPASPDAMTLTARTNPLNPEQTAILLNLGSQPTTAGLEALIAELDSAGLFSRLELARGEVRQRELAPAQQGLRIILDHPPDGVSAAARRDFNEIMAELAGTRVLYVGEIHTRYEDHLLQLRVLRAMYQQDPRLAVAMEMFPVSAQPALDAYVAGELNEPEFLRQSDYFTNWSFDYRLYRDIIDFARRHELPIIALNLERGITSQVFQGGGIAALSPEELEQIPAKRDLALPDFHQRLEAAFTIHDNGPEQELERFSGFLQAQSLWDEQMASRMAEFLRAYPDHRLLAVVGQGHSDRRNAIPPRLGRRLPVTQRVILPMREQPSAPNAADYFFFIPPQSLPDQALLGVMVRDGEEPPGALVANLSPHGKAGEAGIQKDDLLVALNEWEVTSANDLRIAMLYQQPGETVMVRLKRPVPTPEERDESSKTFASMEFAVEL